MEKNIEQNRRLNLLLINVFKLHKAISWEYLDKDLKSKLKGEHEQCAEFSGVS